MSFQLQRRDSPPSSDGGTITGAPVAASTAAVVPAPLTSARSLQVRACSAGGSPDAPQIAWHRLTSLSDSFSRPPSSSINNVRQQRQQRNSGHRSRLPTSHSLRTTPCKALSPVRGTRSVQTTADLEAEPLISKATDNSRMKIATNFRLSPPAAPPPPVSAVAAHRAIIQTALARKEDRSKTVDGGGLISSLMCCWIKPKTMMWKAQQVAVKEALSVLVTTPFIEGHPLHEAYLEQYWFSCYGAGLPAAFELGSLEAVECRPMATDGGLCNGEIPSPDFLSGDAVMMSPQDRAPSSSSSLPLHRALVSGSASAPGGEDVKNSCLPVAIEGTAAAAAVMNRAGWPSFRRYVLEMELVPQWNQQDRSWSEEENRQTCLIVPRELYQHGQRLRPQPKSPLWKLLGFQSANPRTDFRGGGLLSLLLMLSLAQTRPALWSALMSCSYERGIPGSAALVNLTFMLTFCLGLQRQQRKCAATQTEQKLPVKSQMRAMAWLESGGPASLEQLFAACCRCLLSAASSHRNYAEDFQRSLVRIKKRVIHLFENETVDVSRICRR